MHSTSALTAALAPLTGGFLVGGEVSGNGVGTYTLGATMRIDLR